MMRQEEDWSERTRWGGGRREGKERIWGEQMKLRAI